MGSQLSKKSESKSQLNTTQLKSTSDSNSLSKTSDANRRKSSVDSDITPNYITSTSIKPIGSNSLSQTNSVANWRQQSLQQSLGARTHTKTIAIPSEIVVVSEGSLNQDNQTITFPPLFKPIIPIGYESLSLSYPQINSQYVIDLGLIVEEELRTKAELVSKEQNKLIDRIKDIDLIASHICGQFVNERQRRLNKVFENCSKIEEINSLIEKCENDINKCSKSLEKLNNYLPQSLCLEKFEFH
jgi:hypothetical protein